MQHSLIFSASLHQDPMGTIRDELHTVAWSVQNGIPVIPKMEFNTNYYMYIQYMHSFENLWLLQL